MNWRAIGAIIRKDLKVILRSKAVLLPLIIVPVVLQVLMPAGFGIAANVIPETASDELEDLDQMLRNMPPSFRAEFDALNEKQLFLVLMLVYLFAPMYLIVPLMV